MADYPSPPTTTSSSAARVRRRRINNSSVESASSAGSNVSQTGFTQERYRVGAPPLEILPLDEIPTSASLNAKFVELESRIQEICSYWNLPSDEMALRNRVAPGESSGGTPTILIKAHWNTNSNNSWLLCVNDLRELLISNELAYVFVEVLAWDLFVPQFMGPIVRSDAIYAFWDSILEPKVVDLLQSYFRLNGKWRTIDVLRIGSQSTVERNPVTISIKVDEDLNEGDWLSAEADVQELVRGCDLSLHNVDVIIERGDVWLSSFPLRPPHHAAKDESDILRDPYATRVPMGGDFGSAQYFNSKPSNTELHGQSATLGGYFIIDVAGKPSMKVGVTNYHAIRAAIDGFEMMDDPVNPAVSLEDYSAAKGKDLENIDKDGIHSDLNSRFLMKLEAPSRRKHNFTVLEHNNEIVSAKKLLSSTKVPQSKTEMREELNDKEVLLRQKIDFFDNDKHYLGIPYLASGFCRRTPDNARLDWALLEVESERLSENRVPGNKAWKNVQVVPPCFGALLSGVASFGEFGTTNDQVTAHKVFKVDGRTGPTRGAFSEINSSVSMKWDSYMGIKKRSREYVYIGKPGVDTSLFDLGPGRAFGLPGDSGSFVFLGDGRLMGLLWGGPTGKDNQNNRVVYFTDAQDLIDDIYNFTSANGETGVSARLPDY
ncbi:hypothetical protein MMC17_007066 [Xylographa soralifera]|nr:hypothetical protein [Xylographa soralifera]